MTTNIRRSFPLRWLCRHSTRQRQGCRRASVPVSSADAAPRMLSKHPRLAQQSKLSWRPRPSKWQRQSRTRSASRCCVHLRSTGMVRRRCPSFRSAHRATPCDVHLAKAAQRPPARGLRRMRQPSRYPLYCSASPRKAGLPETGRALARAQARPSSPARMRGNAAINRRWRSCVNHTAANETDHGMYELLRLDVFVGGVMHIVGTAGVASRGCQGVLWCASVFDV